MKKVADSLGPNRPMHRIKFLTHVIQNLVVKVGVVWASVYRCLPWWGHNTPGVVGVCHLAGHGQGPLIEWSGCHSAGKVRVGVVLAGRGKWGCALNTMWHWLGNMARRGGWPEGSIQLGPVGLVDTGDKSVVRHLVCSDKLGWQYFLAIYYSKAKYSIWRRCITMTKKIDYCQPSFVFVVVRKSFSYTTTSGPGAGTKK